MPPLHCPAAPWGHCHYSNSLSLSHRESTISSLCSCPLACVRWLEQGDHLGALLLVTVGCSFHRPDFNDSLHCACLCVHGGQCQTVLRNHQKNPSWLPPGAKTPSHHLHTRGNRIIAHLVFAFKYEALSLMLLQTSLNKPNSFTESTYVSKCSSGLSLFLIENNLSRISSLLVQGQSVANNTSK